MYSGPLLDGVDRLWVEKNSLVICLAKRAADMLQAQLTNIDNFMLDQRMCKS